MKEGFPGWRCLGALKHFFRGAGSAVVATAGESGIEAALIGALHEPGNARATMTVTLVAVPVRATTRVRVVAVLGVVCERVLAVAALTVTVEATPVGAVIVTAVPGVARRDFVPKATSEAAQTEAGAEAGLPVTVSAVPAASTGEGRVLVPAERPGDLLERLHGGLEVISGNGIGDLRADAVDDGAQALLGVPSFVREAPGPIGIRHPAELDEPAELVRREWACIAGDGSVDAVQQPPVATRDPEGFEGGGELGRHRAVGGLEPVPEGAGVLFVVLRGLVQREADPEDARRTRIALTDDGRRIAKGMRGERRQVLSKALESFTEAEKAELARLLGKLADNGD